MRSIIRNWIEYCEADHRRMRCEYETLFMDNVTDEEVQLIFSHFENSEELSNRMIRYLKDYRNGGIKNIFENKKESMENLLRLDFEERKLDIEGKSYFDDIIIPTKYVFNPNFQSVKDQIMGDMFSQEFDDYFGDSKIDKRHRTYALKNAISRISTHYSYTQYLFQPLVNMNYTAIHIYEFLMRGGTYAVIDDTVYYSF